MCVLSPDKILMKGEKAAAKGRAELAQSLFSAAGARNFGYEAACDGDRPQTLRGVATPGHHRAPASPLYLGHLAGLAPGSHGILCARAVPRGDGDRDMLTSFHTGFTLFLMTLVLFFTPAGSNAHGSDRLHCQTAGKDPKIPVPPGAQAGSRASSDTRSSQEEGQALLLAHRLGCGVHRRAPEPRFEPQPCHEPCWKTPGKSS